MVEGGKSPGSGLSSFQTGVQAVRESVVTGALITLVMLLLVWPATLKDILDRAGIHSVSVGGLEIETQLEEARQQVSQARAAVVAAKGELESTKMTLDMTRQTVSGILQSETLRPIARAKLSQVPTRLELTKRRVDASTDSLAKVTKLLDRSAENQRRLLEAVRSRTR